MSLSQSRLRELLRYNPRTGNFTARVYRSGYSARKGSIVGTINANNYRVICIDGKLYRSGRLAFLWMTGSFPTKQVDHKNRNRNDDRWTNLRLATSQQNKANRAAYSRNRIGLKGVHYDEVNGRYRAGITVNYRWIHLGRFPTARAASAAYMIAARKHFGDFARAR